MHTLELVSLIKGIESQPTFSSSLVLDDACPSLLENWQGREEDIEQLTLWLEDENVRLIGIEGLGGFGKSTLAARLYESQDGLITHLNFRRRFWAGVSHWPDFTLFARALLTHLGQLAPQAVAAIVESQLVNAVVSCLQSERYLLVIDNLETLLYPDGRWRDAHYEQFFTNWLSSNSESVILITTQIRPHLPSVELQLSAWRWQHLEGLEKAQGAALLRQLGIQGSEAELQEFSQILSGHPLLLKVVAGFLNEEEGPNPRLGYLHELWLADLNKAFADPNSKLLPQDFILMVVVLEANFSRLNPKLQTLLLNLSVYRCPFNRNAAMAQLPGEGVSEQDLEQLVKRCLLQEQWHQNGQKLYKFQPFILTYALSKIGQQTIAHKQAVDYYLSTMKDFPWKTLDDLREYLEIFYHRCQLKQYALAFEAIQPCDDFLTSQGFHCFRIQLYGQLLHLWEPSFVEKPKFMDCFTRLGNAYFSSGQYAQATESYQQLLRTAQESNAPEWKTLALGGLGSVYFLGGQIQNAIELFEQCLEISKVINDDLSQAKSLNNLGNAYNALGQFQQAITFSLASLDIYRQLGVLEGEATALIHLGYAYICLGQYQQAIECCQQSLQINQSNGFQKGEADALTSLGNAYYSLKQYNQAIDLYQQSLAIEQKIGDRRGEGNALGGLGRVYRALRQYPKAIEYYRQSLEIAKEIGDRQGEAISLGNLGTAYYSLKQYQLAIDYSQQQQAIAKEIGDRQGEANSLGNMGIAYQSLGQYQLAIDYHNASLAIKQEIADKRGEANSWFNLGNSLSKLNQVREAIAAYEQARTLYQAMGLDTDALDADNAIERLSMTGTAASDSYSPFVVKTDTNGQENSWLQAVFRFLGQFYQRLWGLDNNLNQTQRRQGRR